jgi:hypothetical protein
MRATGSWAISVGTVSAQYTRLRGERIEYLYDATWERHEDMLIWSARVRCDGFAAGVIDGQINIGPGHLDLGAAVCRLVERRIERGEGLDWPSLR